MENDVLIPWLSRHYHPEPTDVPLNQVISDLEYIRSTAGEKFCPAMFAGWSDEVRARYDEISQAVNFITDPDESSDFFEGGIKFKSKSKEQDVNAESSTPDSEYAKCICHYIHTLAKLVRLHYNRGQIKFFTQTPCSMLGYTSPRHSAVWEFGTSLSTDHDYPEYVKEAAFRICVTRFETSGAGTVIDKNNGIDLSDYGTVRASLPRGKNTGLPLMASGNPRSTNHLTNILNVLIASCLYNDAGSLDVLNSTGLAYVVFSRYQRSGKEVPILLDEGEYTTRGIEARRRIINSPPKALSMVLKPMVKWFTYHALLCDEFTNDRDVLRKLSSRPGRSVMAVDASRFDMRHGGVKLISGLNLAWKIIRHFYPSMPDHLHDLILFEALLPTIIDNQRSVESIDYKLVYSKSLRSGSAFTSRVGSLMCLMDDLYITSKTLGTDDPKKLVDYYINESPSTILGDDLIKYIPNDDYDRYVSNLDTLKDLGLEVEPELPVKFLGYVVADVRSGSDYRNDDRWSVISKAEFVPSESAHWVHTSSSIHNMFFPERYGRNAVASLTARYIISKSNDMSDALLSVQKLMTDGSFLSSTIANMMTDYGQLLHEHYTTHPNQRAVNWYLAANFERAAVDSQFASKQLYADIDSILDIFAHGSQDTVNWNVLGLQSNVSDQLEKNRLIELHSHTQFNDDDMFEYDEKFNYYLNSGDDAIQQIYQLIKGEFDHIDESNRAFIVIKTVYDIVKQAGHKPDADVVHRIVSALPNIGKRHSSILGPVFRPFRM